MTFKDFQQKLLKINEELGFCMYKLLQTTRELAKSRKFLPAKLSTTSRYAVSRLRYAQMICHQRFGGVREYRKFDIYEFRNTLCYQSLPEQLFPHFEIAKKFLTIQDCRLELFSPCDLD